MSDPNAIEAFGLVKRYGEQAALDGVDLDVPRGAVCALLGPNGAGKTTAVRVLTTLTKPDAGSARVAGHDVLEDPVSVRRSLGLAAQDATVDGLLTGRENLEMIGELHHLGRKQARVRAVELLDQFSLADAGQKLAKEYSGGMRRRLDLAATLVARPEILFLDEPTTGLDPRARNELWGVLDGLVGQGTTILLTTQYLEEADRLADDIIVVDHGHVIARGDARAAQARVRRRPAPRDRRPAGGPRRDGRHHGARGRHEAVGGRRRAVRRGLLRGRSGRRRGARERPRHGGHRRRGPGPAPADARRRLPDPDRRARRRRPADHAQPRTRIGSRLMADAAAQPRATTHPQPRPQPRRGSTAVSDTLVIARRGVKHMRRQPEQLTDATIQPIMFVLLFAFVFGGAIDVPDGGSYKEFLMGGIFAQTIVFGCFGVAMGLAYDRNNGAIDRFHSLPISRGAVLGGHSVASLLKSFLPIVLMSLTGLVDRLADQQQRASRRSPATA